MKNKILSTVFVLSVCIMTACGNAKTETNTNPTITSAETVTESMEETIAETTDVKETETVSMEETLPEETKETEPEESEPEETKESEGNKKTPETKTDKKQEETKPAETKTPETKPSDNKKDTGKTPGSSGNNGGNSGNGGGGTNPSKPAPSNPTPAPQPTPTPTVCNHTWDAGTVTVKATCSKEGTKTYTCTKCQEKKTESIAKTEHDFALTQANELCNVETCWKTGCYAKQCKNCGYIETYVSVPMLPHNRDEVKRREADCGHEGKVEYRCSMCHGLQGEETIPATGQHTWITVVLQDWTWDSDNEWYKRLLAEQCSVCHAGKDNEWWEYKKE